MAPRGQGRKAAGSGTSRAESYRHPEAESPARPEAGTQAQFKKRKGPARYRYDSSLSPLLEWDGQNGVRELGEWLLALIEEAARLPPPQRFAEPREFRLNDGRVAASVQGLEEAVAALRALSAPFLTWTGKAERLFLDVPSLPLFVHERLSTAGIIATLKGHKSDPYVQNDLFADPQRPIADQVLRSYEYMDKWVNRMVLGDSLVVMNSLLHYEGLGGQVQMIYMDPPYGVKFGSNFQPFVRKRDVSHNDDEDMTREPEMVKAYRDTWELGLHSYLSYMRDRLLLSRDLLHPSGSIFVQISDENLHHVRELMDEVFGAENFVSVIPFRKKTMPLGAKFLESVTDYLIWFSKDCSRVFYNPIYDYMSVEGDNHWNYVELHDGTRRKMTREEIDNHELLPSGSTPIQLISLYPAGINQTGLFNFSFRGKMYSPPNGNSWFTNPEGMEKLAKENRLEPYEDGNTLRYVLKLSDSPVTMVTNLWSDTSAPSDKKYVVQTSNKVIQRCLLMTTRPGDLVLDPTCGSGTTAFVAEQWGRRWITADTSRVPLALARQRILTATFPWYDLLDEARGPASGFVYMRRQNQKGEEVGGIVPYITKGSIASDELPGSAILVDRPELKAGIVRVSGPFVLEATIPTPQDLEEEGETSAESEDYASFIDRMLEILRRSPLLHLGGGRQIELKNIRLPAKTLSLSAEAFVEATAEGQKPSLADAIGEAEEKNKGLLALSQKPVALLFGPENGAVSEGQVFAAAREARAKDYSHFYVIAFAIQPNARKLVEECEAVVGIPATYVQATPDLMMGDLLKNMRSSQIFSVCGLPDIELQRLPPSAPGEVLRYSVRLLGLDLFDPSTMETKALAGDDVPAWFLDTDYNDLCFHVSQAFFPRTGAWESLKKALKGSYEDSVWEHLQGAVSAPFEAGDTGKIAVKVIDDRGNELLVVKSLAEARS